jgi:hypothetical protein
MKRVLIVFLGLTIVMTIAGLVIGAGRPLRWPANLTASELRRALGERLAAEEEAAA